MCSDKRDDGGPAFPSTDYLDGMSLRDYFAGQALAGLVQDRECQRILRDRCENDDELHGKMAEAVYQLADAMIEAGKKDV